MAWPRSCVSVGILVRMNVLVLLQLPEGPLPLGPKRFPTALLHLATKQEEKREEEGKETVAEVFAEEKGSGDITVSDLENWLR